MGHGSPRTQVIAAAKRQVTNSMKRKLPDCVLGKTLQGGAGKSPHRKSSPDRLRIVLDNMAKLPVKENAAMFAGVHVKTLDYWLKLSAEGNQPHFEIEWRGLKLWFHEHYITACEEGDANLVTAAFQLALGYDEIQSYQGRVIYQVDDFLWDMGLRGRDAYLLDEKGRPIPEVVRKQDPEMIRWLLERRKAKEYGKSQVIDVQHSGGLLVVTMPKSPHELEEAHGGMRQVQDVEFEVIDNESDGDESK